MNHVLFGGQDPPPEWAIPGVVRPIKNRWESGVVYAAKRSFNPRLDGCIVWNAHNTVFGSKRMVICAPAVYFLLRRGPVSRDSIVDGDWLPATEWCQCYLPCCQPASDVAKNMEGFLYGVYSTGGMTLN